MKKLLQKANISDNELNEFLNKGKLKKYLANEYLLKSNECCNSWIFIKKGVTRHLITTNEGKEITKNFTTEQNFVFTSISSFLSKSESRVEFQTLTDCEIIEWEQSVFNHYFNTEKWQTFYHLLLENLILKKELKEISLLNDNAEKRYLKFINSRGFLLNIVPHYHIASYLSMSPETLSRIRKIIS